MVTDGTVKLAVTARIFDATDRVVQRVKATPEDLVRGEADAAVAARPSDDAPADAFAGGPLTWIERGLTFVGLAVLAFFVGVVLRY